MKIVLRILCIIILLILLIFFFLPNFESFQSEKTDIDFVYTWVENNETFQNEILKYKPNDHHIPTAQYTDTEELKYSIRSIFKYAPWFHHIYIVVKDGQCPSWLNTNDPHITLVQHSDIIPANYLPTFNSIVIESYLHHIPQLSEKYIYFNDDIFLWKPVTPNDFFTQDGKCIHSVSSKIETKPIQYDFAKNKMISNNPPFPYTFMTMIHWNATIIENYLHIPLKEQFVGLHIPLSNLKSVNFQLDSFLNSISLNDNETLHSITSKSRFRNNYNIARVSLFLKYFYLHLSKSQLENISFHKSEMIELSHLQSQKHRIKKIFSRKYKFINLQNNIEYNDPSAPQNGIPDMKLFFTKLSRKFPKKSQLEL